MRWYLFSFIICGGRTLVRWGSRKVPEAQESTQRGLGRRDYIGWGEGSEGVGGCPKIGAGGRRYGGEGWRGGWGPGGCECAVPSHPRQTCLSRRGPTPRHRPVSPSTSSLSAGGGSRATCVWTAWSTRNPWEWHITPQFQVLTRENQRRWAPLTRGRGVIPAVGDVHDNPPSLLHSCPRLDPLDFGIFAINLL